MNTRALAKGQRRKNEPITPEDTRRAANDHAERDAIRKRRRRGRQIKVMRAKHSAGSQLRPFIDDLCRLLARSEAAYVGIADLLDEIASELRSKARKARDRIVREVDRIRPKLAEANRLAKKEVAIEEIDKRVELTKWIDEVDAEVTVREIFVRITQPKRHKFFVDAYWLVGKIRDVSLEWRSVKRIYGQHRQKRN